MLRVYSDAANFSTTTINIPDQATIEQIFVPFSSFVVGGGSGATFASVGAIEVLINGVLELDATVTVLGSLRPSEVTSNLENLAPSIEVIKSTNGQDANTQPPVPMWRPARRSPSRTAYVAREARLCRTCQITDDNGTAGNTMDDFTPSFSGGDTNGDTILDMSETWTYTATRTATAGQYTNIANVTSQDSLGTRVADTDPSNHFGVNAAIAIVKSTNGQDANTTTGPVLAVGSTATFTYVVTNTGNVPLGSVLRARRRRHGGSTADDFTLTLRRRRRQ